MGVKVKKKKITSVFLSNRRKRERARVTFLFFLLFLGLFGIFVIIETFSETSSHTLHRDEDDFGEEESNVVVYDYNVGENTVQSKKPALFFKIVKSNTSQSQFKIPNNVSKRKLARIPIQSDWQPVTGSADKFYVYSAYYIAKPSHMIRVIGAARTKTRQRVQCRLFDNDGNHYSTVDGTIRTIRENWNLKYSACFIICNLPEHTTLPYLRYVSIISASSAMMTATNILRIQHAADELKIEELESDSLIDFSTCVKPIHFKYDNVLQFLEWMEFHKLMGVKRFTFYNHTIGKNVGCLLQHVYQDQVSVLPWNLPMISQKEIRTEGLFAALNDCVYRHRGSSKYLILVDLDEMIVPRRAKNYTGFVELLDTLSNKKKIGAYSIQNGFFYMQWPNDPTNYDLGHYPLAESVSQHLLMLRKTRRKSRLHPHKQRSKYICDPEKVVEAGNHFVWEMIPGYNTLSVPSHLASLHHYRVCEFGGNQCVKTPFIVDRSIMPFGQILAINVAQQLEMFSEKCHVNISTILDDKRITTITNIS